LEGVYLVGNPNWETPPEFFDRCIEAWGPFDLDAAANKSNAKCAEYISARDDALCPFGWPRAKRVWLNPPYKDLIKWVERAIDESDKGDLLVCMLLPNDTDTRWYQLLVKRAEMYTTIGRIKFIDPRFRKAQLDATKKRSPSRQGHIVALIRPPVDGVERPVGVIGRIEA
jgi:phage N-6-adenine-methyltransferase